MVQRGVVLAWSRWHWWCFVGVMASCTSCRRRTTSFCYVHKAAVCDDCIVSPKDAQLSRCEANCVIRNYFDWLADNDYEFPPQCSLCNRSITADAASTVRLVCKCLFHRPCLTEAFGRRRSADVPLTENRGLRCPSCNAAVYDPHVQARTKLRETVVAFLQAVDEKDGGQVEPATNGRHDSDSDTASKPTAPTSTSATSLPAPLLPSTSSSSLSHTSSRTSSAAPSRQRAGQAATSTPGAMAIDIAEREEKQHGAPSTGRAGRAKRFGSQRTARSGRWRLDRVIGCVMIMCFLGSVLLYLALSNQWLEPSQLARRG